MDRMPNKEYDIEIQATIYNNGFMGGFVYVNREWLKVNYDKTARWYIIENFLKNKYGDKMQLLDLKITRRYGEEK